jgi:hypothetical protein
MLLAGRNAGSLSRVPAVTIIHRPSRERHGSLEPQILQKALQ